MSAQVNTCDAPAGYICDGNSAIGNAGWGPDCTDGSDEVLAFCCINAANYAAYGVNGSGVAACDDYFNPVASSCDDELACNFGAAEDCAYAAAGFDCNGDCLEGAAVVYTAGGFAYENSFSISDCDGNVLASMASGADGFSGCVVLPENYTVDLVDSYGDTWNGGSLSVDGVEYTVGTDDNAGGSNSVTVGECAVSVLDCVGTDAAGYEGWATDAYCDDGAYGINFLCDEWNWDNGACGHCADATALNYGELA